MKAKLKKIGGSYMVALPKRMLDMTEIDPNGEIILRIKNGRFVISPMPETFAGIISIEDGKDLKRHIKQERGK